MLSQIVSALGVVVGAVIACSAYFYFSNKILDLALPVKDGDIRAASRNLNRRASFGRGCSSARRSSC